MTRTAHIDFETRSTVDLKKTGVHIYASDPTTAAWCMSYALDDESIQLWKEGEPLPFELYEHISSGGRVVAHNAGFEIAIWNGVCVPRYGWPELRPEQTYCTAAMAAAMSLPRDLAGAAAAVGLEARKDEAGHRLMMQMAKPRLIRPCTECCEDMVPAHWPPETKIPRVRRPGPCEACGSSRVKVVWWDDDERKQRLYAYCVQDTEVERQLEKRLMPLSAKERQLWLLDYRINARGVRADLPLINKAEKVVDIAEAKLDAEMKAITGGHVTACSQVYRLIEWLQANGCDTSSVAKDSLADLLDMPRSLSPDIDQALAVRRALELRREAAKASTAKLSAMKVGASPHDGRLRGSLMFHGASTGRWTGLRMQLHNFPRPTRKFKQVEEMIALIDRVDVDGLDMMYGPPLGCVADSLRSMLIAAPGKELYVADFSNIEGRDIAWMAGEAWKLKAFRAADDKTGPEIYSLAASQIYNCSAAEITKEDPRRQVGKVSELALGYQGGVGAFVSMAKNYNVKMDGAYPSVWATASPLNREKALEALDGRGQRFLKAGKMTREAWLACELVKLAWRDAHPATVALWKALEEAAVEAVQSPGKVIMCGKVKYRVAGSFLWCLLPSGRALCYPYPRLKEQVWATLKDGTSTVVAKDAVPKDATVDGHAKPGLRVKGVNSTTRKWEEYAVYGGFLAENCVQAIARDQLADAMLRVEEHGFPLILTVHDELVAEAPISFSTKERFEELVAEVPAWSAGCPIVAAGYVSTRYKKD